MNELTKGIIIIVTIFIIFISIVFVGFGILINQVRQWEDERDADCEALGIDCSKVTIECSNDCRLLGFEGYRHDKEGFGAWACYCLKPDGDVMKIW